MTTEYNKPLPVLNDVTRPFFEAAKRHELVVQRCKTCNHRFMYPREICPSCMSFDLEWMKASGKGRLYSFGVTRQPAHPAFSDVVPFIFALVQLEEGPRMISNLVECAIEDAYVDMPVEVTFDDVTPEFTLVKFKPG